MVRINLKDVFGIILVLIIIIGGVYGSYLLYIKQPDTWNLLEVICAILSVLLHLIAISFTCIMISELSEKTIEINTDKIKEKLKQLIK